MNMFLVDKIDLVPQITSIIISFLEFFICTFLLTIRYKKKKNFFLRLLISFIITIIFGYILSLIRAIYCTYDFTFTNLFVRQLTSLILFFLEMFFLFYLFDENKLELLICNLYFEVVNTISSTSFSLLLNCFRIDDTKTISFFKTPLLARDFTILALHHLLIFIIFALLYYHRQIIKKYSTATFKITISLLIVMTIESIIGTFSRIFTTYNIENAIFIKIYTLLIALLILFLIVMILRNNTIQEDLKITEELLYKEKKNYETSKQNIESINAMVHDFKHTLQHFEKKLNNDEIQVIKNSIKLYELNIKTGNNILDSIIYEKQLICSKNNIQLTCMANGELLSFITPYHLYSLFGNALDNAIEAVKKVSNNNQKIIGISVFLNNSIIQMEIYNYYLESEYSITTKSDLNHHGYGLKNIEYIINLYNGKMEISKKNNIFSLLISFPIKSKK